MLVWPSGEGDLLITDRRSDRNRQRALDHFYNGLIGGVAQLAVGNRLKIDTVRVRIPPPLLKRYININNNEFSF